jgi:hypothetical protein
VLSDLEIAQDLARCAGGGSAERIEETARYQSLSRWLGALISSPYLAEPERRVLAEARAIVDRLAAAADLATDGARRQIKAGEAMREVRYRRALGLLGPGFAPDPARLEASVIELLALDRYSGTGRFGGQDSVEAFEAALRRRAGAEHSPMDLLFRDLEADHQALREAIARDWAGRETPLEELYAQLSAELPRLREATRTSPPVLLQGTRRLLAVAEAANVVPLPPRPSP